MPRFAVSVLGLDRPGIVAAVTRVLADAGCNLEDGPMTLLRGHFAMMLLVSGPDHATQELIETVLDPVGDGLDLQLGVRPVTDTVTTAEPAGERYVLSVYGSDRPGLVARVTEVLAARRINIVDLQARVIGEPEPVYAMHYELEVPAGALDGLDDELRQVERELDVRASLQADEADVL
jgi:glycine cleavage system transcriptional repressor